MKLKPLFLTLLCMALIGLWMATPSHAAGRTLNGSIGLETPIWVTQDRPQDDSPMVKGELHLNRLLGPVGLYGGGQINFRKGLPWCKENKLFTGLEMPVGKQGLVAYTYFERRFDTADNRYVIGCKYNFRSPY